MACSQMKEEGIDVKLKQLGFIRTLTTNAIVLVSNIYDHAKQNSGSLKSTVDTAENAVTTVVGPVYDRLKSFPWDLLIFLDSKVDEATHKFDECASPAAKNLMSKTKLVVIKASQAAQDLAEEAKVAGPFAALSHATTISKHFAVSQLAVIWYKVNRHPTLRGISEMAIPTAAQWSEKYNNLVKDLAVKGHTFFNYVPLVPVEEMAKAYKRVEETAAKKTDTDTAKSESDSSESK